VKKIPAKDSDLPSFHHPSDECSCGGAYRKRRRNSERKVSLEAASCLIQEFFASIATLLCGMPHYSHAILYRIGNRACCARGLVSRFDDVVSRSLHYGLGHRTLLRPLRARFSLSSEHNLHKGQY
jgi:hypothetical protein